ncbi:MULTISPECIES: efflux RND transporter permease subunit [unclassified Novosphingobium]|uniref:efflux RND transporter permease subunit n=1 Tax=unclassified Novosphingobium TaxID=2644732 RepID=UPI000EEAD56D|nr:MULTISPECIES: efflux RND transporter permease subunit [unclassified Novosphingobium]HCF24263.1 transporter [Novosphingobium sp.]HQV02489.1 efflux RND transporter permease subunit [Novosphingobium sp.]
MNFQNISAWCIRNPVVPIVLFIALILGGMVTFSRMKVQNDPDIEFPLVVVFISQPGAAPTEIENQITQKVESSLRSLQNVQSISSTAREGASQTEIEFEIGTDVVEALNDVKNAVDQVRGSLPDGILEPEVTKIDISSDEIGYFSVLADDMTIEQLSWFVDDTVTKNLLSVPGLAQVNRGGGVTREIAVILDPGKMQANGVSAGQINQVLRQLNLNAAGGRSEIGGSRQSVRVLGNTATAYQLSQTDIPLAGGRVIKLADIAKVTDSYSEVTSLGKTNGKMAVTFGIQRGRGESDVSVYDAAVARLEKIEADNPGIKFTKLFTTVPYVKEQYTSSIAAMVEGSILAVIVVFFFLRDWRATMISAIAIPLSAIPSFWFIDMLGITLNQMSLLALGLVAGVLVDDAIVEVENIVRHMRMGKSAYQAAIDAADEIGLAVVATTFSIVAVFLPVGLMPGIPGQFFFNFGWTVVVSVLISLAVARMITPMIAAYFLKPAGPAEHGGGPWMDRYERLLHFSLDNNKQRAFRAKVESVRGRPGYHLLPALAGIFAALSPFIMRSEPAIGEVAKGPGVGLILSAMILGGPIAYGLVFLLQSLLVSLVNLAIRQRDAGFFAWNRFWALRLNARLRDHRVWMLGIAFFALILSGVLFGVLPQKLFPEQNSDFSRITIEMVPGTTLKQTEDVSAQVAALIAKQPEVLTVQERVREANGSLFITLKADREGTSQDFERRLTPELQKFADARVNFQALFQAGPPGIGRPISVMLTGADSVLLEATAAKLAEQMKSIPGVVAPRVAADTRRPELVITPRQELAASLGVTTAALSQTIRIATIGEIDQNAAKFSLSDRQIPIRVRLSEDSRRDLSVIMNLPVQTASGGSVPLSRVADVSYGSGPVSIRRFNQERRVFVGADLAPGFQEGPIKQAIDKLPVMENLPLGLSKKPFGSDEIFEELITSFQIALGSAVLLVFAVLVLLYHRFVSPLVNMASLFLAPLGGLIALWIAGQEVTLPVFIGILMLFGIVAKNSILLIDFAIEEMAKGVPKYQAIVDAGHKRAQPIVMTTVAMTAGMVPTALSIHGDSAWRQPMGTVVMGGLILSTLLTLLIVPAGFSLADGFEKRIGPKLRRTFLTWEPSKTGGAQAESQPAAVPDPTKPVATPATRRDDGPLPAE